MLSSVQMVGVRDMGVVGGYFVVAFVVMTGGFVVMARSVLVMFRCLIVVMRCFV